MISRRSLAGIELLAPGQNNRWGADRRLNWFRRQDGESKSCPKPKHTVDIRLIPVVLASDKFPAEMSSYSATFARVIREIQFMGKRQTALVIKSSAARGSNTDTFTMIHHLTRSCVKRANRETRTGKNNKCECGPLHRCGHYSPRKYSACLSCSSQSSGRVDWSRLRTLGTEGKEGM
eukprot:scaffold329165_cov56-Attheya_sp.AAC.3